jgi:uncharacterized membrane protein
MIRYLKRSEDKDLKCPFDNYWSPHINILKIDEVVDQSWMAGLRWEQRHHDMQNMAKMMMMVTFVKIGVMKLKTGLTYMNIQENKILHLNCVNFCWSTQRSSSSSSSLPYFACHDVVAVIIIQPFVIGQPLHVKFMCLSISLIYMNIQENKILHLNCVNFCWSSKKWFGPVKVLPLLDQMSSEVQGTFGMTG